MTAALPSPLPPTYAEYLALEAESDERHEWDAGEIRAMTGGSWVHARLNTRLTIRLGAAAEAEGCEPAAADARVTIESHDLTCYPDLVIVCGRQAPDGDPQATANPALIVEVLSKSTEVRDRGRKLEAYLSLPSLHHYLLVQQDRARVEVYTRTDAGWLLNAYGPGDAVALARPAVQIDVDALYDGLLPEPEAEAASEPGPA